jgi:hypothetical protein
LTDPEGFKEFQNIIMTYSNNQNLSDIYNF